MRSSCLESSYRSRPCGNAARPPHKTARNFTSHIRLWEVSRRLPQMGGKVISTGRRWLLRPQTSQGQRHHDTKQRQDITTRGMVGPLPRASASR